MTTLMRVQTLSPITEKQAGTMWPKATGKYAPARVVIYNPAHLVTITPASGAGAWQVTTLNDIFYVSDKDGRPDYGEFEQGWTA